MLIGPPSEIPSSDARSHSAASSTARMSSARSATLPEPRSRPDNPVPRLSKSEQTTIRGRGIEQRTGRPELLGEVQVGDEARDEHDPASGLRPDDLERDVDAARARGVPDLPAVHGSPDSHASARSPAFSPDPAVVCDGSGWLPSRVLPGAERALDGGGADMATGTRMTAPDVLARKGCRRTPRHGDGVRRADGAGGRRRRRRHDPRRRLARDGRARLRGHAPGHDRRHGAPRRRGRAHEPARVGRRRPAVAELPREPRRDRAQRGGA